jgi:hypothetical protein
MKKYISKYSNGKMVSAAQYITEIICEHKAKKDKKDLHYRFWTTKYWETYYKNQISSANKLLISYEAQDIIDALNDSRSQKIYSLRAPFLKPIIEDAKIKNESKNKKLSKTFDRTDKKIFRQHAPQKNIISKLEELDND